MSYDGSPFALTPWVRRLLIATGAVYLLQLTVFTSPWLAQTFGFQPSLALRHPWGLFTYALLHGSFLHLLANSIGLFMFGPPVEGRFGSRAFIRLWLLSVLGGSLLSLALLPLAGDGLIIGASGGLYGVMLAFVLEWPDAPVLIFPFPIPVKAKWLVVFFALFSLWAGFTGARDGTAHFAHLGGFAAAFLYLRGSALLSRSRSSTVTERSPAVLVRPPSSDGARRSEPFGPTRRRDPDAAVLAEVDRVLDKISARGLESLTPEERRFLDEMSKRFQQDR
ncbi:MAG: rhomboid family intramembrane serine protease [Gemmatimonadetes bacterium]|nr:rhomboid family intramembrane serine protease [Gemmatimonadota bacterium]